MASKRKSKNQLNSYQRALKKLQSTGLYRGKISRSKTKPPSRYQKSILTKFADVLKGAAAAVVTPIANLFRNAGFKTVGKTVVVPKRKGERVRVSKTGEIMSTQKRAGKKNSIKRTYKPGKIEPGIPSKPDTQYALPLARGYDDIEWMRFGSRQELEQFIFVTSPKIGESYKKWRDFVVEENIDDEHDEEWLEDQLGKQLRRSKRKRKAAQKKAAATRAANRAVKVKSKKKSKTRATKRKL